MSLLLNKKIKLILLILIFFGLLIPCYGFGEDLSINFKLGSFTTKYYNKLEAKNIRDYAFGPELSVGSRIIDLGNQYALDGLIYSFIWDDFITEVPKNVYDVGIWSTTCIGTGIRLGFVPKISKNEVVKFNVKPVLGLSYQYFINEFVGGYVLGSSEDYTKKGWIGEAGVNLSYKLSNKVAILGEFILYRPITSTLSQYREGGKIQIGVKYYLE